MEALCSSIYEPKQLSTPPILHGKKYENRAIEKFEKCFDVNVKKNGLFVNPKYPFLGASPDGLVLNDALVEVKCPFTGRNCNISPGKGFDFLTFDDDSVTLKRNHKYYYQVQGQLGLCQRKYCYFIVYTHCDFFVEVIWFDRNFFETEMIPKLTEFYEKYYRPFCAKHLK